MEEFFLHPVFVAEELNIVDQQDIGGAVFVMETCHIVAVDAVDQVVSEFFTGHINDVVIRMLLFDLVGDGVHQVCFSQTRWTVDEQRIVTLARFFCNCRTGSIGKFVGATHNERGECIFVVCPFKALFQLLIPQSQVFRAGRFCLGRFWFKFFFNPDDQIDIKA